MAGEDLNGRAVLVTGGTGMIGRYLVDLLVERGAAVRTVSLDTPIDFRPDVEVVHGNLMDPAVCARACDGIEHVFHVAGIKGSPAMTAQKPASFFVPLVTMNVNMMEAARRAGAQSYLFTSSVGVYAPADVMTEDDVWRTFPSPNDRFAGWAKRIGELQADAYAIEFGWKRIAIVRPANVYGRYDNFDPPGAMVIPSLIRRIVDGERPLVVWGDGRPVRDFIHAKDVALGMLLAFDRGITEPLNLGSGEGVSIRELVETLVSILPDPLRVEWDTSKPGGDQKRLLDMRRAKSYGFVPTVPLADGLRDTLEWYRRHRGAVGKRLNVFEDGIPS